MQTRKFKFINVKICVFGLASYEIDDLYHVMVLLII